jgi:hypothetical protein
MSDRTQKWILNQIKSFRNNACSAPVRRLFGACSAVYRDSRSRVGQRDTDRTWCHGSPANLCTVHHAVRVPFASLERRPFLPRGRRAVDGFPYRQQFPAWRLR